MSKKVIKIFNLIIGILVLILATDQAFGWLSYDRKTKKPGFGGSSGDTYFAGGSGTATAPYLINNKYHLYNLAWLQNTGKLNTQKYYFKLNGDITIPENFWLPPIGTDADPFIGEFDGNGHTISNLKVTTDKSKLTNPPQGVTFSNAVGMFGMTGSGETQTGGTANQKKGIHSFTLASPVVEVADKNDYNDGDTATNKAGYTAGIAIGYANCSASDIGIYNGKLGVQRGGKNYTTLNSIIGGAGENVDAGDITDSSGVVATDDGKTSYFLPHLMNDSSFSFTDNSLFTSSNGFAESESESRWGKNGVTPTSPTLDSKKFFGFGNFSVLTKGDGATEFRSKESIDQFFHKEYNVISGTQTAPENDLNKIATNNNEWKGLVHNQDGSVYKPGDKDCFKYSFRFTGVAEEFGAALSVKTENSQETITVVDTSGYENLWANSIWFNITEDVASILVVGVSKGSSLQIYKILDGEDVDCRMKLKAAKVLELSDYSSYEYSDLNVNAEDQTKRTTLISKLNGDDKLTKFDRRDFFMKNDYDILKGISADKTLVYGVYMDSRADLKEAAGGAIQTGAGYEFNLNSINAATIDSNESNGPTDASGNQLGGPGLYALSVTGQNNSDIHYIRATGVTHGDTDDGSEEVPKTEKLENIDFTYQLSNTDPTYATFNDELATNRTGVIVRFTTNEIMYLYFVRPLGGKGTIDSTEYTLEVEYSGAAPTAGNKCRIEVKTLDTNKKWWENSAVWGVNTT